MTKALALFVAVATSVACGGASENGDGPTAGSSTGGSGTSGKAGASTGGAQQAGSNSGGKSQAGESSGGRSGGGGSSNGGSANAGTTFGGSSNGGSGNGGVAGTAGGGGVGGGRFFDARCPPKLPTGACPAADATLVCEYSPLSTCLCYPSDGDRPFSVCTEVPPACMATGGSGGSGGAGRMASPAEGDAAAPVAPPPRQRCTCSAGEWYCQVGP